MNKPLVIITLVYMIGIWAGVLIQAPAYLALIIASVLFMLAIIGYKLAWQQNSQIILLLFFCLGVFLCRLSAESIKTSLMIYAGHFVTLEGTVVQESDLREDRVNYVLKAQSVALGTEEKKSDGLVLVTVWQPKYLYGYGDVLKVKGRLSMPEEPGNPGAFNYREYLARQGIGLILSVNGDQNVSYSGIGEISQVVDFALTVKKRLLAATDKTLSEEHAALVKGILFGNCGQIKPEIKEAFQQTGLIHILSVSGLHVGFVLLAVLALSGVLRLPKKYNLPIAGFILVFYSVMTGISPPVLRATVMALMLLLGQHLGRQRDWAVALSLAGLVILLYQPLNLFNPGFQLSFTATWGILYLVPILASFFEQKLRMNKSLGQVLAVPLAAELVTLPLVALHFNLISFSAPLANIIGVPIVGVITLLAALGTATGLVYLSLGQFINISTAFFLDIFIWSVKLFQHLPGAFIYVATPPLFLVFLWYGLVIMSVNKDLRGWAGKQVPVHPLWLAATIVLIAVTFWSAGSFLPGNSARQLTVHFIDVGQGDSVLLQTPAGKNILVDAGGHRGELSSGTGVGDKVVLPYLRRLGVQKLDLLVFTHFHEDHVGGAAAVIKGLPVETVIVPPQDEKPEDNYGKLLALVYSRGIAVQTATAGDRLKLDPHVKIDVLSPPHDMTGVNNDSLVLRISYGKEDFLLTGDIEKEAQNFLLQQGYDLASEVLKVPHHGSRNCMLEFLEEVKPQAVVITVGRNNFGHPALETLEHIQNTGARIYRTDRDGAVIFRTDGNSIKVETGKR